MSQIGRRIDRMEEAIGRPDDPTLIREYEDGETGVTTRVHTQGGRVVCVEAIDGRGRPVAPSLWEDL